MKNSLRPLCVVAALLGLATPSLAAEEAFEAGLRTGWRMDSGNQMAAVQLDLAAGWKTYWRAPGDNGIPPSFDWSGSENVKSVAFHWPRPHVYDVGGLTTIGYKNLFVLPMEVTPTDPSKPIRLKAEVDLGVCSDICIPASFRFDTLLPMPGAGDGAIRAALRQRPSTAKEAGLTAIACDILPKGKGLLITAQMQLPSTGGAETVVFEPGVAGAWVSEADVTRQGNTLTASAEMIGPSGGAFALERGAVTVTVLGKHRAVEIIGCPAS
jgi:DsbC/DsbD-like thiol-disulfide interchange protein